MFSVVGLIIQIAIQLFVKKFNCPAEQLPRGEAGNSGDSIHDMRVFLSMAIKV